MLKKFLLLFMFSLLPPIAMAATTERAQDTTTYSSKPMVDTSLQGDSLYKGSVKQKLIFDQMLAQTMASQRQKRLRNNLVIVFSILVFGSLTTIFIVRARKFKKKLDK